MQDVQSELLRLAQDFDPSQQDLLHESVDRWGNPYQASLTDSVWTIWSLGPDGDEDTEDDMSQVVAGR